MSTSIPPLASRPYDLIVFGATGYTGKYCAEHVTTHLPTGLTWAVAGRSTSKLQAVISDLRALNPDRKQPAVEECALEAAALAALARKTRVLINCVGPYSLHGEPVLAACAQNGTSYVDTTGEVPWVLKMIRKYHDVAQATGARLVPQCGFESAASDMTVYLAIEHLRRTSSSSPSGSGGAGHVTGALQKIKGSASGGTLASVFTLFDEFSTSELLESQKPFVMSPVAHGAPESGPSKSLASRATGTHWDAALGTLTTWPMGKANMAIVQRSWGLLDGGAYYGRRFTYHEYMRVGGRLAGLAVNVGLAALVVLLALPPVRWVARRLVRQQGEGASREDAAKEGFEIKAAAEAEDGAGKVVSRMVWRGGIYHVTAVYMVEAAATLLAEGTVAEVNGNGGVVTPACLGMPFVDRLRKAGVVLEAETVH